MSAAPPAVLQAVDVGRRYGGVLALDGVSLAAEAGSVLCLLGDNGAGKSTLIRILSGSLEPSAGRLLMDGDVVRFASPRHARARGIATVWQDLAVFPLMSVWRNFCLGAEPVRRLGPFLFLDASRARREARAGMERMGIRIADPDRPVGTLSGGERQTLAIARALHAGARVLILDEPTAALGVRQAALVLRAVEEARERGAAVVLVTHNPRHALEVGDRFVVLRRGRVAAELAAGEASAETLAGLMAGEAPAAQGL